MFFIEHRDCRIIVLLRHYAPLRFWTVFLLNIEIVKSHLLLRVYALVALLDGASIEHTVCAIVVFTVVLRSVALLDAASIEHRVCQLIVFIAVLRPFALLYVVFIEHWVCKFLSLIHI